MLKRRNKISPLFSMASMTDVIFLLLIFFMITSTMISPNAIKVLLPQGSQQTSAKPLTRVIIDKNLKYYAAFGNEREQPIREDELAAFLKSVADKEPDMYVALYADESVPYREVMNVLNIASENHFKMVLATRRPQKK
jgi:biopolymer transport protein ExbD